MHAYNFLLMDLIFNPNAAKGVVFDRLIFRFSICRLCFRAIRAQSRKLSQIAPNFRKVFALPNFVGYPFQKLYKNYHACLALRRLVKFRQVTTSLPLIPKL